MTGVSTPPLIPPAATRAGVVAKFFRGLGDPTRLRVLEMLCDGERSVGELVRGTGQAQGRLSSHLACLRWCGFVTAERRGRQVFYRLADESVADLLRLAIAFLDRNGGWVEMCRVIDSPPGEGA